MSRTKTIRSQRGFSLVELIVATALSAMILAGVLSAFVMLGRNSYNAGSYSVMEAEARRALEMFSEDARMSSDITWANDQSITLKVVTSSGTTDVVYAYNSSNKKFTRTAGGKILTLVSDVSEFAYRRYKIVNGVEYTAGNNDETKQIQITLRSIRRRTTVVDATNAVLSARIVLRNKKVTT